MQKITLIKPDDAHLHLRDSPYLMNTVPDTVKRFARAIVMPNLRPPLTDLQQVEDYRRRIIAAIPRAMSFQPLMTLYLTETMTASIIAQAKSSGLVTAVKLYPAGVTTNSDFGIVQFDKLYSVFSAMEENDLPLLIHGEANDPDIDIFDREKYFLDTLSKIIVRFPKLRIVLEHITTEEAVRFLLDAPKTLGATITVHHLLLNRNHMLAGGIRPHYYCLPILKRRQDQEALIGAAVSGNPKFFLGTDSAPHALHVKESVCGCAGVYSAHAAIELYAEVFDQLGALNKLEGFASQFAADFYGLPRNTAKITLAKQPWHIPEFLPFGPEKLVPLYAGKQIQWQLTEDTSVML